MDRALQARSPSFCAWVTKHVSNQCGVGRRMKQWQFWEQDNCPCCGQENETTTHFPFCDSSHMAEAYTTLLTNFTTWMGEADTDPEIVSYFTSALHNKTLPTTEIPLPLIQAAQNQASIGWDNMLFGRLATTWMDLQEAHLRTTRSRRSSERWAADMSYRLLQLSHGLWMARNRFLHERDEQGLLLKEGQSLHEAITERYGRGRRALLPGDHILLDDRSLDTILALPPTDKYTWLAAITLAHRIARTTRRTENGRMRTGLVNWMTTGFCCPVATTPPDGNNTECNSNDDNDNNNNDDDARPN